MKKQTVITIASAFIGFLILLLIVLWLLSIMKGKNYTYEQVEDKIIEATSTYYKNHPELLPSVDGKYNLAYETLVENGYIEPLNKLLKDGDTCSAEINVIKKELDYSYIPRLTCSDKYSTRQLYEQVLSDNDVVTEGAGLYHDENGEYYFKGKVTNNHVVFGTVPKDADISKAGQELVWQIISIDENHNIKMRAMLSFERTVYDNRYNENKKADVGYNDYETSVLKDFLKSFETRTDFLTSSQKAKLVKFNLCVNPRTEKDPSKDGSTECAVLSKDAMLFGTVSPYEYMRASIDPKCDSLTDKSCGNLNYMSNLDYASSWSTIAAAENTHQAYMFDGKSFMLSGVSNTKGVNLVVKLSEYTNFKSGDGTLENPYRVYKAPATKSK